MTDKRTFEPRRMNLTRRDRKELKKIIVEALLNPSITGIDLKDVAEWYASMNDYPKQRKEYLKQVRDEQRTLDT